MHITLELPYPVSANRYWASRTVKGKFGKASFTTTYVTAEAKEFKAKVLAAALIAGITKPLLGRVSIDYKLYPHRPQDYLKRMKINPVTWDDTVQCVDLDNAQKVLLDSLKDVVMEDDKFVRRITAERMEPDEFGARLVVTITEIKCVMNDLFSEELCV